MRETLNILQFTFIVTDSKEATEKNNQPGARLWFMKLKKITKNTRFWIVVSVPKIMQKILFKLYVCKVLSIVREAKKSLSYQEKEEKIAKILEPFFQHFYRQL